VKRAFMYLSALVGFGGMLYLASAATAQPPVGGTPPPPAAGAPGTGVRPTIAVFNMAAVMRDFEKAKFQVYKLNQSRVTNSGKLAQLRARALDLKKNFDQAIDQTVKSKLEKDLMEIQHQFQVEERDVNKALNDEASKIISKLYDEIKMVVDKTAEMNAYHIVFAYPDAVTPEEQANPYLKELKLKPPAAQPFYVSKQVDITGIVIQTLNAWYPPLNEKGEKVDVTKLPAIQDPTAAPGTASPSAPPMGPAGGVPMLPGK
jgi:Skp family chaperone for outer membrane proteins